MKEQLLAKRRIRWLPGILAVALATFLAAAPTAGQVTLTRVGDRVLEISGGTGAGAWTLRYGTGAEFELRPGTLALVAEAGEGRAWFAHGAWLRLIDEKKGVVVGRWRFPGRITGLTPSGAKVEVALVDEYGIRQSFRRTLLFDPAAPQLPSWVSAELLLLRLPQREAEAYLGIGTVKVPPDAARRAIPQLEEAVRRDPLSPWLRVALGKALLDLGDTRADAAFREAIESPGTDYTELLRIASYLEGWGAREAARLAFDRGYADFWRRGNDPRLFYILLGRFFLYPSFVEWDAIPADLRRELIERNYRLTPYGEGAHFAWQVYAGHLRREGASELAGTWQARAEDATKQSGWLPVLSLDVALLVLASAFWAGVIFLIVNYLRYRRQRAFDLTARARAPWFRRGFSFFGAEYWDRRERFAFLTILLTAWVGSGIGTMYVVGVLRMASAPLALGTGSLAGPVNLWFIENRLPASRERDLLLAVAFQQSGEREKAEALYRRLPQFAESWNNLGVLLKESGRESEARQAFEKALQLEANLAEAALNLGQPPRTLWTELHQEHLRGQPMLAPPSRQRVFDAFLAASPSEVYVRAFAGPFASKTAAFSLVDLWSFGPSPAATRIIIAVLTLGLAGAIALVFLLPAREITQPPGRWQPLWETLFPGTARAWHVLGGLVLVFWTYLIAQDWLLLKLGTSRPTILIALPSLTPYGVPGDMAGLLSQKVGGLINPGWAWVFLAPAVLFAVNAVLVWRTRPRSS